jgi:hypothetical protein
VVTYGEAQYAQGRDRHWAADLKPTSAVCAHYLGFKGTDAAGVEGWMGMTPATGGPSMFVFHMALAVFPSTPERGPG